MAPGRTRWSRFYLDPEASALTLEKAPGGASAAEFAALDEDLTYSTAPFEHEAEITGPVTAKLFVSSSAADADLFLTLRLFDREDKEVLFVGAVDPHVPVAQGWLRASQRKIDPARSQPWRPFRSHDESQPLTPGEVSELDVEILPTCIVVPAGYRLKLTVSGHDFDHGLPGPMPMFYGIAMRGSGVMLHNEPTDRPDGVFRGVTTVYGGGDRGSYLLLPTIPG